MIADRIIVCGVAYAEEVGIVSTSGGLWGRVREVEQGQKGVTCGLGGTREVACTCLTSRSNRKLLSVGDLKYKGKQRSGIVQGGRTAEREKSGQTYGQKSSAHIGKKREGN